MTDKAQAALPKNRHRQALRLLNNHERRKGILDEFNRDNTPDVKPLEGNKGMAVLKR